jgi:hypothetical protein
MSLSAAATGKRASPGEIFVAVALVLKRQQPIESVPIEWDECYGAECNACGA